VSECLFLPFAKDIFLFAVCAKVISLFAQQFRHPSRASASFFATVVTRVRLVEVGY